MPLSISYSQIEVTRSYIADKKSIIAGIVSGRVPQLLQREDIKFDERYMWD